MYWTFPSFFITICESSQGTSVRAGAAACFFKCRRRGTESLLSVAEVAAVQSHSFAMQEKGQMLTALVVPCRTAGFFSRSPDIDGDGLMSEADFRRCSTFLPPTAHDQAVGRDAARAH